MSTFKDYFWAGVRGMLDAIYPPTKQEIDERIFIKMAKLKQKMQAKQPEKP